MRKFQKISNVRILIFFVAAVAVGVVAVVAAVVVADAVVDQSEKLRGN